MKSAKFYPTLKTLIVKLYLFRWIYSSAWLFI